MGAQAVNAELKFIVERIDRAFVVGIIDFARARCAKFERLLARYPADFWVVANCFRDDIARAGQCRFNRFDTFVEKGRGQLFQRALATELRQDLIG